MYNPVGSPRLKTASPINQNKIIPRLRLPSTDPVWARRFKPTRPAGAEHPPLSPSSPHAAEPLGSWSPNFSVRVVTQARGGAGRKQNGLPRQLAGVQPATRALKVSISLAGDRSPQRHRGFKRVLFPLWGDDERGAATFFQWGVSPHGGRGLGAKGARGSTRVSVRKPGIPTLNPIGLIKPLSRTFWQSFLRKRGTCLRLHS